MNISKTLLILATLSVSTGCVSQRRSVSHVRIESDRAYVAYAEWDAGPLTFITGTKDRSRVKRCLISPDNSMTCEEDADVNAALNPQEAGKSGPKPAAKKPQPKPPEPEEVEPEEVEPETEPVETPIEEGVDEPGETETDEESDVSPSEA